MGLLTVSGNEITDLARANALAWLTNQQGGSVDEFSADSSFGLWGGATNLFTRGQNDSTGSYASAVNGGASTTFAIDATVPAPFSPQSIKFTEDGGGTQQGGQAQSPTGQALAVGTLGCGSIWMMGTAGQSYRCFIVITNTDASTNSGAVTTFNATGAWQLVVPAAMAVQAGKTGDRVSIRIQTNSARAESFRVAHPMLQSGTGVVTPYVATSGSATATRAAARVQMPSTLLAAPQSWIALRIRTGFGSASPPASDCYLFDWRDDANNRISLRFDIALAQWVAEVVVGGVVTKATAAAAFNHGDLRTLIIAWGAFGVSISLNGAAFTTVAGSLPSPSGTTADLGNFAGSNALRGDVMWSTCGKGTLTNADASTLNALGNTDPALGLLGSAAQTTMVWAANTALYNSYVDAPVTNDISATTAETGAGTTLLQGGGAETATTTFAGSGTSLLKGSGNELATATLTGFGVVYDQGGSPFFGDSLETGSGLVYSAGGGELEGVSTFAGLSDLVRPYGPRLRGRIARPRAGSVRNS